MTTPMPYSAHASFWKGVAWPIVEATCGGVQQGRGWYFQSFKFPHQDHIQTRSMVQVKANGSRHGELVDILFLKNGSSAARLVCGCLLIGVKFLFISSRISQRNAG